MVLGLHSIDLIVLIFYLVGITILGLSSARWIHKISDFIMPRRFGKGMLMMHAFGTGTHSDQAVSVASKTYTSGISGIWYQWLWLFVTPFYWLIAPLMRRFRAQTTADVFKARYGQSVAMLFAVVGIAQLMVNIGVMLKGSGAVITASTGGLISSSMAIMVMTFLFVIYGMAGGLGSAIITDFAQGILTIFFSFLLLPFILPAVGGLTGIRETIADPQMLSLIAPWEIGLFYIIVIAINGLIGIVTQPHTMGNCAAGRTEMDGRVGFMVGNFIKRICTIAWTLTGIAAVVYFSGQDIDPDQVFGKISREFLPRIFPGMLGIFIASLVASVMSSCDSFMIASSALFTQNIYKHLRSNQSEKHYILIARITALFVVVGGVIFAFWLPGVVKGLEIFWKISPMMGIAFWLGLFWRRATTTGAWTATLTGFIVWWLTSQTFFINWLENIPGALSFRFVVQSGSSSEIYLPWQMVFYLSAGTIAGIIGSLLSQPTREKKLENFYGLVRTPVETVEDVQEPCTLPEGKSASPRRNLFPNSGIEIQRPDVKSILGFLAGWVMVALIILIFVKIVHG